MKTFTITTDIWIEARLKHAHQRGDIQRIIELRLKRGDDPINIAADIAAQEG